MSKKLIPNTKNFITTDGKITGVRVDYLKFKLTKFGYNEVCLFCLDGSRVCKRVHRLVAEAFIDNPENKPFVNHINGIKTDNRVENLEWCTHQENMDHAKETGLIHYGERNRRSIMTEEKVHEICRLLELGKTNKEVSEITGVNGHNVSQIRNKFVWVQISSNYNIPKKSRILSESTIRWICARIEEGLTQGEIIELSENSKVKRHIIKDIRRKAIYTDISKDYNF